MRIVFFGTPEFAVESLDAIIKAGHDIAAVVTMPDKIGGRGHHLIESDVKKYAVANNLHILQPEKLRDPEFIKNLEALKADLFIVIAFRMLPEIVWNMPPMGTFNLHASLLPKFRGAAPINHAIISGEKETGVTTFLLNHEIDAGKILMRKTIPISDDDTAGTLHDKLMKLGAEVVVETVKGLEEESITPLDQLETEATPAPKIFSHTCQIDFNKPLQKVHDFIRGHSPYPCAWAKLIESNGKPITVKLSASALTDEDAPSDKKPGDIIISGKRMLTVVADRKMLEIKEIQPAGKKRMDAKSFLAGYHPARFEFASEL